MASSWSHGKKHHKLRSPHGRPFGNQLENPPKNGPFQALQKINPQVRSVLLSGFSLNEQVQEVLDMGALDFLGKPFEQMELSKTVASAIESRQDPLG